LSSSSVPSPEHMLIPRFPCSPEFTPQLITPFASRVTYMPSPGNHERADNFTEYQVRFRGVEQHAGRRSGSGTVIYYAYTYGLTRYVHFSSEAFVYYQDQAEIDRMIAFIAKELKAVDRSVTPWVVAIAHKSWTGIEKAMNTNFTAISPLIVSVQTAHLSALQCNAFAFYRPQW